MPIHGDKHRFTRKNVELAPDAPGVYALYADGEVAFYGAADGGETIRSRLSGHLWGREMPGRAAARLFSYEVTRYPLSRECALLEEHRRTKARLPRFNERPQDGARPGLRGHGAPLAPGAETAAEPLARAG